MLGRSANYFDAYLTTLRLFLKQATNDEAVTGASAGAPVSGIIYRSSQ